MKALLPKILKWTEIIGLVLSTFGVLFKVLHYPGASEALLIGMLTLAATYYLFAFVMVEAPTESVQPKGMADLMPFTIRKVLFIGLAVFIIGSLFKLLHFKGANEMLMIGVGTVAVGTLVGMALILVKRERMKVLQAPLLRCLIALVIFGISLI